MVEAAVASSSPVALAKQKSHFWRWRDNRFDEGDSSCADPGRGSLLDQLDRAARAKQKPLTKKAITVTDGDATVVMEYTLDTKVTPVVVKFKVTKVKASSPLPPNSTLKKDSRADGIVELKGDKLWICYDPDGGAAPKSFDVKGTKNHVFVLKLAK
jgi:uncharacterized protein (TIGR03067 family)